MAVLNDARNLQKASVRGPALEEFSTRAQSIVSEREMRLKQGEAFFFTDYKAALANASARGLIFRLLTSATCFADVTLHWRTSGLCTVELLEDSYYTFTDTNPWSVPILNQRRSSSNAPDLLCTWSEGGGMTAGTAILEDIVGAGDMHSGSFRFMPKKNENVGSDQYCYWLRLTNNSGGAVSIATRLEVTEYEEIR